MDCEAFVELVTAHLDGTLDPDAERRFAAHLAGCDGCDRYLAQLRTTVGTLGRLTAETLTEPTRDRLLAAFRDWPRNP
jgi:anti-sigma factor RsiW